LGPEIIISSNHSNTQYCKEEDYSILWVRRQATRGVALAQVKQDRVHKLDVVITARFVGFHFKNKHVWSTYYNIIVIIYQRILVFLFLRQGLAMEPRLTWNLVGSPGWS
jgi:hypothetical protein